LKPVCFINKRKYEKSGKGFHPTPDKIFFVQDQRKISEIQEIVPYPGRAV
jgi:hypothetical protein